MRMVILPLVLLYQLTGREKEICIDGFPRPYQLPELLLGHLHEHVHRRLVLFTHHSRPLACP